MRFILFSLIFLSAQLGMAKISCSSEADKVTIDTRAKEVEIIRNGHSKKLQILEQNHHAYRLFGEKTYALPGGYVLGLKKSGKSSANPRLTVFHDGEPVTSMPDCKTF
ncbi:MAG: hypothetical protein ACAH59_13280 [Pseudobdellovibrionaceae bacterium]